MKCLKNTTFPIEIIFKQPDLNVQGDWCLISGWIINGGPQILTGGVILYASRIKYTSHEEGIKIFIEKEMNWNK